MRLSYLILVISLSSCTLTSSKEINCEGFNLKRLPFGKDYFIEDLYYTDGVHMIKLDCIDSEISRSFRGPGFISGGCNPDFSFSNEDTLQILSLSSNFHYYPLEENRMLMGLSINSSNIEIMLDTINIYKETTINLGKKYNLGDSDEIIKKIKLEKLRIVYVEMDSGEIWRLVKK